MSRRIARDYHHYPTTSLDNRVDLTRKKDPETGMSGVSIGVAENIVTKQAVQLHKGGFISKAGYDCLRNVTGGQLSPRLEIAVDLRSD
mmetsp:Transcript_19440/g.54616  ORF Transcript_19440/g.54616 Transcript_19440/m.54616 type:complete len:88 (+) Transcript_19440:1951-2214(+)